MKKKPLICKIISKVIPENQKNNSRTKGVSKYSYNFSKKSVTFENFKIGGKRGYLNILNVYKYRATQK